MFKEYTIYSSVELNVSLKSYVFSLCRRLEALNHFKVNEEIIEDLKPSYICLEVNNWNGCLTSNRLTAVLILVANEYTNVWVQTATYVLTIYRTKSLTLCKELVKEWVDACFITSCLIYHMCYLTNHLCVVKKMIRFDLKYAQTD